MPPCLGGVNEMVGPRPIRIVSQNAGGYSMQSLRAAPLPHAGLSLFLQSSTSGVSSMRGGDPGRLYCPIFPSKSFSFELFDG